jgi:hypothetical protein
MTNMVSNSAPAAASGWRRMRLGNLLKSARKLLDSEKSIGKARIQRHGRWSGVQ